MRLTSKLKNAYNKPALTKTVGAGFGDSNKLTAYTRQHIRLGVFLCLSLYMVVCVGRPQGLPVSVGTGSPTLRALPPQFGDFGGDVLHHLSTESVMTNQINGQSRPQFTREQIDLVDTIALSLERLNGIFGLIAAAELDETQIDSDLQVVLCIADELIRKAKAEFSTLTLGGEL